MRWAVLVIEVISIVLFRHSLARKESLLQVGDEYDVLVFALLSCSAAILPNLSTNVGRHLSIVIELLGIKLVVGDRELLVYTLIVVWIEE